MSARNHGHARGQAAVRPEKRGSKKMKALKLSLLAALGGVCASVAGGRAAYADALSTPVITPPLSANPNPASIETPVGKIYVTGQLTGLAYYQDSSFPGEAHGRADISNAQFEVQKADGLVQFYVQAGAYSLPALGAPYVKMADMPDLTYKWIPLAFIKIQPNEHFNIMAGKLPTLIGAENTFTFQNLDIARGLLWNQEPAVSRGVQANLTEGPWAVSMSLNDGYYSSRLTTLSGLATYTISKTDTVAFSASGQLSGTARSTLATPLAQNNGQIFDLIWTHTAGGLTVTPYLQYGHTPKNTSVGLPASGSTFGGAVLAKYSFTPMFSLAGRAEYLGSSGGESLLYGPKSKAWSLTITPTLQIKTFFVRGEASYTKLVDFAPGAGFGSAGSDGSQTRLMLETGVLF